jgi:SagB-type dehydrogenase family enzyme
VRDWGRQPEPYKVYAGASRVALPDPRGFNGLSLEEAIATRRSRRDYAAGPLTLEELSRLLWAAQGITEKQAGLRAAPSAGALYPIELYPVIHNVVGLKPGIYHYAVRKHALELVSKIPVGGREGDFRAEVVSAGLGQGHLGEAAVCFVYFDSAQYKLSAIFQRLRWKYRERTYRYALIEAGHIGQNLYLAATALGLGACAVGAFLDDELNDLLGIDGEQEAALIVISVGKV